MPTTSVSAEYLSGAPSNGRRLEVTATVVGSAQTIHTATSSGKDEVYLDAFNTDSVDRTLTIAWGGTSDPDDLVEFTIPAGTYVEIVSGWLIGGGLTIGVFASAANVVTVGGRVHRLTEQ